MAIDTHRITGEYSLSPRLQADWPQVVAAVERRDVESLCELAQRYEGDFCMEEARVLYQKLAELDPSCKLGKEARAWVKEYEQVRSVMSERVLMSRQTKAGLAALVMFVLFFLAAAVIGEERFKALTMGYKWLLGLYVFVLFGLTLYWRGLTWARLQAPVWGENQMIPIEYDPKMDAKRRRRLKADQPRVKAAIERQEAEFLYNLALEYEENFFLNEAIDLLRKAGELDPSGETGAKARAKLTEWGLS